MIGMSAAPRPNPMLPHRPAPRAGAAMRPPRGEHPHRAQLVAAAAAVVWLAGFVQAIADFILGHHE